MTIEHAPKSRLEEAGEILLHSSRNIEREFYTTTNPWLSCFGSQVFQLESLLATQGARSELGDAEFERIGTELEKIKERLSELKILYPQKSDEVPQKVKDALLESLKILD